ncbi:MAG: hypothetical protein K0R14_1124 [Burkholderiales bacterium]|jgi:amino acid adenylation domain-containing protein/thioester reductase-like protein|nr:hypothetical protein [Burkholderiales bacterium]
MLVSKNAIIFGETGLTISCIEHLLHNSWNIIAVLTQDTTVNNWCKDQSIQCLNIEQAFELAGYANNCFIFSIINPYVLSAKLLTHIKPIKAINYHDSLLPKYAGVNSTTWALLGNEQFHGITWHEMIGGIDEGDIYYQAKIPVDEAETAFSLNLKCTDAALIGFKQLITDIEQDKLIGRKQDLFEKTYFGRDYIPNNYAYLNATDSIFYINKLFNSLNFGEEYINPIAIIKIEIDDISYILEKKWPQKNIDIFDSSDFILKDIYGKKISLEFNSSQIQPCILGVADISSCRKLKQKEFNVHNSISKLLKGFQAQTGLLSYSTVSDSKQKIKIDIKLSIDMLSLFLSIILSRLNGNETFIKIYHKNINRKSKFIRGVTENISILKVSQANLGLRYIEFAQKITEEIDNNIYIFKDFAYRYKLDLNSDFAITNNYQGKIDNHSVVFAVNQSETTVSFYKKDIDFIKMLVKTIDVLFVEYKESKRKNEQVKNLLLLSAEDYQKVVYDWNKTEKLYSQDKTIHQLFEEQAARTPNNIAVVYKNLKLTYQQLNERSNQLANYLRDNYQIQGNDLIALCLSRSKYMLIAILGVLKSGAAYVPIDPDSPSNRIHYILEDTKAKLLMSDSKFTSCKHMGLENGSSYLDILRVDDQTFAQVVKKYSILNPILNITSKNLAYVIYTSGTTGLPKGVMLQHQGIVNRIEWMNERYPLRESDRVLQKTPYIFDVSVWELFWGNWYGATIVFAKPDGHKYPEYLIKLIEQEKITIVHFVPSMLRAFTQTLKVILKNSSINLNTLCHIFCSGERLPLSYVKDMHKQLPEVKIHNLYGPTEAAIDVLYYDYNINAIDQVYIGRPISNITCYILDNKLNPLPIGSTGELYIGGVGLALGYLNLPDLTDKYFIANPFQTKPEKLSNRNTRIYKTGDLVRMLPNGTIDYIGRNDFQIKIRGYRIELGEIESQLIEYPGVKQSVVLALNYSDTNNSNNDKYLAAYYVADAKLGEIELLNYLSSKLPAYMLPKILIHLDKIPLNINGKLDRKALPKPEFNVTAAYIAPSNELEAKVCTAFAEVLGLDKLRVGVDDNFFQLGGNSILAINLVNKLNNFFHSAIKVIDVFNNRTSKNISALVKASLGKFLYQNYLINGTDRVNLYQPFDLNNVQQAYYFGRLGEFELGNISTHIYSELIFNELDTLKLEEVLNRLIAHHVGLRTIFINGRQQYLENVHRYKIVLNDFSNTEELIYNNQIKDNRISNEKRLLAVRNKLSHKIYKADQFPLFDFVVSKLYSCYILHISVDALLMDGNSYNILFNQLRILYDNPQAKLPILNVTYRDYIVQLMQIRQSTLFNVARNYWLKKLDNYNFTMNLPLKCKVSQVENPIFRRISTIIDKTIWGKIEEKSKAYGISNTALILNIYGRVLSYWTNQDNLCINLTLFNRLPLHTQINDVIGDFTSLELFNYRQKHTKASIFDRLQYTHKKLWTDIEHNLFDGIDFQRLIRKESKLASSYIIAPVALTSMLGTNTIFGDTNVINNSYQGVNYSITQTSQLWLDNKAYTTKDGFIAEWDYVEQLFDRSTIENMHSHYCYLIKYLADADWNDKFPNLKAPNVDIALINKINDISQVLPTETLFSFYENYVKSNKLLKNTAVIDHKNLEISREYSYAKLLNESELLAKYICSVDAVYPKVSQLIAILSEKGYNQVIASVAIMKSGCGYLPLNIDWPAGRIEDILAQSKVDKILISKLQVQKIKQLSSKYKFLIIEDVLTEITRDQKIQSWLETLSLPEVASDDIAYVIFTSGSTGVPKGVTISHRNALNTILAINNRFRVTKTDKILSLSELSFDLSVYDIFGLLAAGGTIVFPKQNDITVPKSWVKLIHKYKITIWNTVPQLANLLIDSLDTNSLRLFLISGDWVSLNLMLALSQICPTAQLTSLGGATEGSIWSIWYEMYNLDKALLKIPYGTPMPNQRIYVLNNALEQIPFGVIGEIYIGGIGVALNYWNDSALTKESFILHPELGRIYKTGDLGYWHKKGYVEFMGRRDSQIKLNGYRIELEEIKSKIINYPDIKNAVVLLNESLCKKTGKYIVAYYISKKKLDEALLLNYLVTQLPGYMIPQSLIHLNKLPLTKNGKLDQQALPQIFVDRNVYVEPRNELERQICRIYSEILNISPNEVGITDDFFKFGGNSILAIKFANKLATRLNIYIAVVDLFKYNTIAKILKHIRHNRIQAIVIPKASVSENAYLPLSFAQERLWFIEKYEGGTNAYNIPLVAELNHGVDVALLKEAIISITARHEVLHTLIKTNDFGDSCQFIGDLDQKPLIIDEYEVFTEIELSAQINQAINHIYQLDKEYPIKVSLFNKNKRYYICIVVHHIAFDGWSIDIFLNEVKEYYNYYNECKKLAIKGHQITKIQSKVVPHKDTIKLKPVLNLPELSIQYKDYAIWQKRYLTGKILEEQIDYWKNKLNGYETLDLPLDNPRPPQISYVGNDIPFTLAKATSKKIRELAKNLNVSLFSILLSGYYILLSSYSNQNDITIGIPVANRHYKQLEYLIGFFVNSLALRSRISKSDGLISYIKNISEQIIEAQAYQDIPFAELVSELNAPRDTSRHPVFQVMFTVQSFGRGMTSKSQLFKPYKNYEFKVAKFDITTFIDDSYENLGGMFNYSTSLFNESTILNLIKTYKHILEQIAQLGINSQKQICNLSYLTKEDYQKVIHTWNNNTAKKYPQKTVHKLFEEQVERTPNNIAVVYEDIKLTYMELNERSNQLANYLREIYQIQGDDLIALCLNRSEYMLIAILGILKSGAAYVPIDPEFPIERICYILKDIRAKVLITTNKSEERSEEAICYSRNSGDPFPSILVLDDKNFVQVVKKYTIANTTPNITNKNLAYVIYTSGTTGKPKGVLQPHSNVVNLFTVTDNLYKFNSQDVWVFFHSYIFDFSVWEIFGALLYGGRLIIPNYAQVRDLFSFYNLCKIHKVTVLNYTPKVFYQFIDIAINNTKKLGSLRFVILGGDTLDTLQLKPWFSFYGDEEPSLINMYGITEATVHVTYKIIKASDLRTGVLIGKIIPNYKAFVLDNNLNPLPIGSIGELYIGGSGVAQGYLNQLELTKERFINNFFQSVNDKLQNRNTKLYKTGDLVRYLPDGSLEYVDRNDFQVKIRGYRIELGEIESTINHHPSIWQSVVVVNEINNSKYLIAYYVADYELDETLLAAYLATKLPDYMLPTAYIYINRIPLTINGKLDKKALPSPLPILNNEYLAPRNAAEIKICMIYSEILSLPFDQIGINHDFFRLGGNSILAIKLLYKLQQEFKINLNDIFSLRTPARIAQLESSTKKSLYNKLIQMKVIYDQLPSYRKEGAPDMQKKKSVYLHNVKNIRFMDRLKRIYNVLLTGVTGHLGCHILYQLLHETEYKIYLLIRARSNVEAYNRINKKFKYYFDTGLDDFRQRIVAIAADIEKPDLSLSKKQYNNLIDNIDSIVHSAALVKHYGAYATFYQANIQATINLLELAKQTSLKDFHYISTLSVIQNGYMPNYHYYIFNEDDSDIGLKYNNVYIQTKYEGELATIRYREFGVNTNIYRLGNLAMNSENYRVQENYEENAFFTRIKTILKMGIIPKEIAKVEISPVDNTALAIVKLFNKVDLSNNIYHVANPHISNLSDLFAGYSGVNVKIVVFEEFIDAMLVRLNNKIDREQIERFMLHQMWLEDINLEQLTKITVLQNKTDLILSTLGFRWSSITSRVISDIITKSFLGDKKMKKKDQIFEYLESIAELIPAPFYWLDAKGICLGLNTLSMQAVGATRKEDVIGKTVYEFYQDVTIAREIQKYIDEVIKTGVSSIKEDKIIDVTTGQTRYSLSTRAPLRNKKGEIIGIVGTAIETTAEKEAERLKHENRKLETQNALNQVILEKEAAETERLRLENAVQKLENEKHQAAAEEQEKFRNIVGQVLHDIQSPLASLKGIVEDTAGNIPEEKRVTLRQASMRIHDIAQNMLIHFRNEPNAAEMAEPLLVSTALLEILSEKRFEHKSVNIDTDIAKDAYFACIQIEPSQFKRMISNVVNNAVHAIGSKTDGAVTVELKVNAEWVTVFVEDNGRGMPQDLINKIESNVAVTAGKENGIGLGLTQVREVLNQNFGQLSISSVEGEYTKVMLKFPKILPPFWLAEEIKIAPTDTVVVLDDDPSIHGAWDSKLRPVVTQTPEIRVMHFSDGQEAVNFINLLTEYEKEHICLLADYELLHQDINGLQVIEQTKVKRSTLVTSHYTNAEIREHAANLHVRILPKMLAFAVTINLIKDVKPGSKNVDLVWVNDARWYIKDWTRRLSHLNIDTYYDPNNFLEDVHQYPLDTKIILDRNYYDREGIGRKFLGDGLVIAKTLHEQGYTKLFMVTGEKLDPSIIPDYLTVVLKADAEKIKELADL